MPVLIAVARRWGGVDQIATVLAQELAATHQVVTYVDGHVVADLAAYPAVLLGCGVYAGALLPATRAFLVRHRAALSTRALWVFSAGALDNHPVTGADLQRLLRPFVPVDARDVQVFPPLDGAAGTTSFRTWEAIQRWAREMVQRLATRTHPRRTPAVTPASRSHSHPQLPSP